MNKQEIENLKKQLEKEKKKLELELSTVGRINPDNPNDWEAVPSDMDDRSSDLNDFSDNIEAFETNTAILKQLETQLIDVKIALKKIDEGKYGICEVCGKEIGKERLEANPAARVCQDHMK
jgi:RNA polymerase-binding transcription factor DksA